MINLARLPLRQHTLIIAALHTALAHADTFPFLDDPLDGGTMPTKAEADLVTETCRYVLQNQIIPDNRLSWVVNILDSVSYLWTDLLGQVLDAGEDTRRYYGIEITYDHLEQLNQIIRMFRVEEEE